MQEMIETAGWLDSHPRFLCNGETTNFGYRPRISDRPFSEAGIFERLSYSVITRFSSCLPSYPACPDWTTRLLLAVEARAIHCTIVQFYQEENKLHMECLWCPSFSQKLVSDARSSHVSCQQDFKLLKHLNVIFCRSSKCLKITCLCKVHLCASKEPK